jgi:hypothetical protein
LAFLCYDGKESLDTFINLKQDVSMKTYTLYTIKILLKISKYATNNLTIAK